MPFKLVTRTSSDKVIRAASSLSNDELIELYKRTKLMSHQVNLLKLIEAEGRKRQMLYFLTGDKQLELCKSIFGEGTGWNEETERG